MLLCSRGISTHSFVKSCRAPSFTKTRHTHNCSNAKPIKMISSHQGAHTPFERDITEVRTSASEHNEDFRSISLESPTQIFNNSSQRQLIRANRSPIHLQTNQRKPGFREKMKIWSDKHYKLWNIVLFWSILCIVVGLVIWGFRRESYQNPKKKQPLGRRLPVDFTYTTGQKVAGAESHVNIASTLAKIPASANGTFVAH